MKKAKIVIMVVIVLLLMSAAVYAQPSAPGSSGTGSKQVEKGRADNDPVKRLEQKKAEIRKRLAEGKITREEAERKIARIDEAIGKIKEFDRLTVPQKKEKLIKEFETRINEKVQQGRLTQDEAKQRVTEFKEKIEKWDGSGYPFLRHRGSMMHGDKGKMPGNLKD